MLTHGMFPMVQRRKSGLSQGHTQGNVAHKAKHVLPSTSQYRFFRGLAGILWLWHWNMYWMEILFNFVWIPAAFCAHKASICFLPFLPWETVLCAACFWWHRLVIKKHQALFPSYSSHLPLQSFIRTIPKMCLWASLMGMGSPNLFPGAAKKACNAGENHCESLTSENLFLNWRNVLHK